MDYNSKEFDELKKLRRQKIKESRHTKTLDEIFDDDSNPLLTVDEIPIEITEKSPSKEPTKTTSKKTKESNNDDHEDDDYIRFGKIKIKGVWEFLISIFAMVVFVVMAWVRFEMGLNDNTERIVKLESQSQELRGYVQQTIPALQQNIELRITAIDRELLILENQLSAVDFRTNTQITRLVEDVNQLKAYRLSENSDLTDIIRRINQIERRLGI